MPCGCTSGSSECCLIKLAERESQFRQRLIGLVKLEGYKFLGVEHGKRIRLERGWRPRVLEGCGCYAREFRLDPVAGGVGVCGSRRLWSRSGTLDCVLQSLRPG